MGLQWLGKDACSAENVDAVTQVFQTKTLFLPKDSFQEDPNKVSPSTPKPPTSPRPTTAKPIPSVVTQIVNYYCKLLSLTYNNLQQVLNKKSEIQ